MWKKGSITIFYSLLLTIILALISTVAVTAKTKAGRAQIAMCMDMAMFSAMSKYDKELFKEFHLFFMDGGYCTHTLQMGNLIDEIESDLSYTLMPSKKQTLWGGIDFLDLSIKNSAITGYTLATDNNGSVFREQVLQYMKDTMVLQNISSMFDTFSKEIDLMNGFMSGMEVSKEELEDLVKDFSIDELSESVPDNTYMQEDGGVNVPGNVQEDIQGDVPTAGIQNLTEEEKQQAEYTKELLKTVARLKKSSILHQVLPGPYEISGWEIQKKQLLSNRHYATGLGVIESVVDTDGFVNTYLFQEYLLQNMNFYGNINHQTGPVYAAEYIICGKNSDVENLEGVVKKLLLMRETANVLHLYTNSEKRAQAQSAAALVSALLFVPELTNVIEAAIILSWAYVESLVDVSGLLSGKSVPLLKTGNDWQVGFAQLPMAAVSPEQYGKDNGTTSYKEYLSWLMYMVPEDKKTMRAMDMVEAAIRGIQGKEDFSLNCAVDTLEVSLSVVSERNYEFQITERRSYRCM